MNRGESTAMFDEMVKLGADLTQPGVFQVDGSFRFGPPIDAALCLGSKKGRDSNWNNLKRTITAVQIRHDRQKLRKMSVEGR